MAFESAGSSRAVGRSADLRRVAGVVNRGEDSTTGALLVVGERGMGRTTVLNAASAGADVRPMRLVAPVCQSTSDFTGLTHALSWTTASGDVAAMVADWLDILAHPDVLGPQQAAPHQAAQRLLGRARELVSRQPLTIEVDDAHLLDRSSQLVVGYLALHGPAVGLHGLLSADEAADLSAFAGIDRLRLRPLDVPHLRTVLEGETDGRLPYRVAELVHTWSGGNPALALDLVGQLSDSERRGEDPIGPPLLPTAATVERLGQRVAGLSPGERRLLAVFARFESVPADLVEGTARQPGSTLDRLVAGGWLRVSQGSVEPRRRADAVVAWATLVPSVQHDLHQRFADQLQPREPAVSDYFAALADDPAALGRLVVRAAELLGSGRPALAAAVTALVLHRGLPAGADDRLLLAQLLSAEGYGSAALRVLYSLAGTELPAAAVSSQWATLAAIRTDPSDAQAQIDVTRPPTEDLDEWLTAVFTICRVQLGLDGPAQSARLLDSVQGTLGRATPATVALAELVAAERDVYEEKPGSAAALQLAVERWTALRSPTFDLSTVTAAFDLLGLGLVTAARDLMASVGPARQLPFAIARSAVLTVRVEADIALGQFRRASAQLAEVDREAPSPSGTDLVIASQAIRIGAVCDDLADTHQIEQRLLRSTSTALSYASRRAHTAALGFRELVHGNFRRSRNLLGLALQGPALLLQGRSCVLADLIEATAADGDRRAAAALLARHSRWLPDQDGERSRGLLARCRAMVAGPEDVDSLFAAALLEHAPAHETDRARTLLAYGRALLVAGRLTEAEQRLTEAAEIFRELRLPGWLRHIQQLLDAATPPAEASPGTDARRPAQALTGPGQIGHAPSGQALTRLALADAARASAALVHVPPVDPERADPGPAGAELNDIERQIVALVMQRKRNREIAAALYVSLRTVEGHLTRIFRKLGVSTKAQLLRQLNAVDPSAREPA